MKDIIKIRLLIGIALFLSLMILIAPARAGGDKITQSNDMNNQTTGDVTTSVTSGDTSMVGGENKSLALVAPSLGDVDIAACLGSTQWSFLIMGQQKLELNYICMAEFYLTNGLYELAAQSLCNQKEILAEYEDELSCEAAHNFGPTPVVEAAPMYSQESREHEILEDEHENYQAQIAELAQELAQVKNQPPQVIERTVIEQRPVLSDKQRNALAEVINE